MSARFQAEQCAIRRTLCCLLLIVWPLFHAVAEDATLPIETELESVRALLDNVDRTLASAQQPSHDELSDSIRQISVQRTRINECVGDALIATQRIEQELTAYGSAPPADPRLAAEYRKLETKKTETTELLAQCRVLLIQADQSMKQLSTLQNELLRARLVGRQSNVVTLAYQAFEQPSQTLDVINDVTVDLIKGFPITPGGLISALVTVLLAMGVGFWLKHLLLGRLPSGPPEPPAPRLPYAFARTSAKYLAPLCAAVAATLFLSLSGLQFPPVLSPAALVALGVATYLIAVVAIRSALAPVRPARQVTRLPDDTARALCRRLLVLTPVILIGAVGYGLLPSDRLVEPGFALIRSIYLAFLTINLAWLIWIVGRVAGFDRAGRGLRLVLLALLAGILAAEALGYRNLAGYLITGLLLSMAAGIAFWFVDGGLRDFFDSLETGRYAWQRRFKQHLALTPDEPIPGLIWLRLTATALTWGMVGLALLRIWGLTDTSMALVLRYLVDGFTIGETTVVPSKVLTGVVLFAILLALLGVFRETLEKRWLTRTRLDAGVRETLVAVTSYTGFTIAVLVGLSLAGFNLGNIALIAGALSVGIGFGLQNVVNNFVSGIILLFERPVRPGDWVVVGATEGYVKKIRVRSTEIQTFDRSEVIVPNSEFISSQVTNWTLRDPFGRVIVPIGVAYGTDPELVRETLLEATNDHPRILQGGMVSEPKVIFRSFGDSALLFELRCFIRDINYKLDTISDLNYAIARLCKERGIEIPFPQRDLHLRSWDPRARISAEVVTTEPQTSTDHQSTVPDADKPSKVGNEGSTT